MEAIKTLEWKDDKLFLIDCRLLPEEEKYYICNNYKDLEFAIKNLVVRGAPAIGVAAAYGVVLGYKSALDNGFSGLKAIKYTYDIIDLLSKTRPTAVNLFWALDRMKNILKDLENEENMSLVYDELLSQANRLYMEDIEINKSIGKHGKELVKNGDNILTHCNAGALATAGYGTALGVVRASKDKGIHLYIDETRPLLQGSRLTAWEMIKEGIPATLIADNMAGDLMKRGKIDIIIFGADRIANNGDVANKIGSYSISVLAKYHKIPVYVAAPKSTIDMSLNNGEEIPIEERDQEELKFYKGRQTAPRDIKVFNPAFDVTPNELISGIITEDGVLKPPFNKSIKEMFS